MAITAVATPVTASTGATTPRTIPLAPDASTAPGDLVVVVANTQDVAASEMTLPAPWAELLAGQQAGTMRSSIWTKTWQAGDAIELSVAGTDGTVATVITVKGAGPATVGPVGLRAATGTATTNVAPGVAAAPGSLVLLYSGERTNSTEPEPTPAEFTNLAWRSGGIGPSAPAVSLLAAVRVADGPVPDTTIAYPNTSAANGLAVMLVISPADAPSGSSVVGAQVSSHGRGRRRAHGASFAAAAVDAAGRGAKRADGAQASAVVVPAVGAGRRIASGRSVAKLAIEPAGGGRTRRHGTSRVRIVVTTAGAGYSPDRPPTAWPDELELDGTVVENTLDPLGGDVRANTLKVGDTTPVTWRTNVDITGATLEAHLRREHDDQVHRAAVRIIDAGTGTVAHDLPDGLPAGKYDVEIRVVASGHTRTAPTVGRARLNLEATLA